MTLKRANLLAMVLLVCSSVVTGGCGGEKSDQAKAPLTQAQRDSVMAASKLPGAGVVGKALTTADSAAARAKRLDEATGQ